MIEPIVKRKYEEVSKLINKNSNILDIGCGDSSLKDFVKPSVYIGIDVEKKNVENLKKQGYKSFLVDLNNYSNIPLKEKFDYILFLDVLEHVVNPSKTLRDFKKFLNVDGKLIVSLPNDYHLQNKIRFLLNKNLVEFPFWEYGHLHTFPIKEGRKFLKEQGFRILKIKYLAPEKPIIVPLFIKKFLARAFPNNFARVVIYELSV